MGYVSSGVRQVQWPSLACLVLPTPTTRHPVAALCILAMATQVETATMNGIKANSKIKSKNQLRRLKAKQKKAEEKAVKVC